LAIPIKAYTALVSAPPLPAHLLHAGCGQRLHDDNCCPRHGKLEPAAVDRGYEHAPGRFLVVHETGVVRRLPPRDRTLALDSFVDLEQIDPLLYAGRSLYLAPDGLAAAAAYTVLSQALRTRRQAALARLVLSGRRHLALVRPTRALLLLHLLH